MNRPRWMQSIDTRMRQRNNATAGLDVVQPRAAMGLLVCVVLLCCASLAVMYSAAVPPQRQRNGPSAHAPSFSPCAAGQVLSWKKSSACCVAVKGGLEPANAAVCLELPFVGNAAAAAGGGASNQDYDALAEGK